MQHRRHLACMSAAAIALALALPAAAYAASGDDDYPTDPRQAMQLYESNVEDWADGPVGWIMLDEEQDIWDDLASEQEKQEFIEWFWARRDPDLRDRVNPVEQEFYSRVALANERFNGFPRGWKSDRGRVLIALGPPEGVHALGLGTNREGEQWTYLTVGPRALEVPTDSQLGEFNVYFVLREGASYELASDAGIPGTIPPVVRRALDKARDLYVQNPDLELGLVSDRDSS